MEERRSKGGRKIGLKLLRRLLEKREKNVKMLKKARLIFRLPLTIH